ncbi:MAG TPA: 30S ribosomal protein S21 [Planctomycetota bacterium]|nr:30S ribosomal protein S21 [Planctomycetota bacterium]
MKSTVSIRVQVRPNESLEAALRRFKRQVNYAGIYRQVKKAAYYEKPSEKRRREARERVRTIQKAMRKQAGG